MVDFFKLWEMAINKAPNLKLEIGYTKICDYNILIWDILIDIKRGPIINIQYCDIQAALADAYVKLHNYLMTEYGGY